MDTVTATESNGSPQPSPGDSPARAAGRNVGRIEEIQGVVIEAVFSERLPEINHAITVARPAAAASEEAPGISTVAAASATIAPKLPWNSLASIAPWQRVLASKHLAEGVRGCEHSGGERV